MTTRRSLLPWAAAVAVLATVVVIGRPSGDGPPLDPGSSSATGTKALVLLLEELGAEVDITRSVSAEAHDVALVLADALDDPGRTRLRSFADGGGTVVVTDPSSALAPAVVGQATTTIEDDCDVTALTGVEVVDPSAGLLFDTSADGTACFDGFVVVADRGAGTVAAIGGAGAFVNEVIGNDDNAVLAGALLAPRPGTRVAFLLQPPAVASGDESLTDLVPDRVRAALWQLGIAFAVYALWRGRRLGRPVEERQPVELAASELVVAVGNLLQQAGRRDQASWLLRDDFRRQLGERLGLGPAAPPETVAEVAAQRTGADGDRLRAILVPTSLGTDLDLVALAAAAESLRQELLHV